MQCNERRADPEMRQQRLAVARVFRGDQRSLAQHALRARRKILQIADRRGDHP